MKVLRELIRSSRVFNFNQVGRDEWIRTQAERVPAGSRVLDIGAGSSPYRRLFSNCVYHTQDFGKLEADQLRGREGYSELDYECDVTEIPVADGSYDVVLCTEVLEHTPEPIRVVDEIYRVLRPGGMLILTAPLGSGIHQEPFHFYGGYTPYWYQRYLDEDRFQQVFIEPNGGFFKHYGQNSIQLCRLLAPWKVSKNPALQLVWGIGWLLMVPAFGGFLPVACHFLDRFDRRKDFTIGYHVWGTKRQAA